MIKNVGNSDKVVRVVLAVVLAGAYMLDMVTGTVGTIVLAIAVVLIITSFMSFCPLYKLLGINTCPVQD